MMTQSKDLFSRFILPICSKKSLEMKFPFRMGNPLSVYEVFGEVEEFTVQVNLHHATGSAFERGDPKAACVGKVFTTIYLLDFRSAIFASCVCLDINSSCD